MTSYSDKLRAVFLTALMIGSVFAAGIAFTGSAAATDDTLYVDGDNSNGAGTSDDPYGSISTALSNADTSGVDTIIVRDFSGGTYNPFSITSGYNDLTIKAASGASPVVSGNDDGTEEKTVIDAAATVTLDGLTFTRADSSGAGDAEDAGIFAKSVTSLTVKNSTFNDVDFGIQARASITALDIQDTEFSNIDDEGVIVNSNGQNVAPTVSITGTTFDTIGTDAVLILNDDGGTFGSGTSVNVSENTFKNVGAGFVVADDEFAPRTDVDDVINDGATWTVTNNDSPATNVVSAIEYSEDSSDGDIELSFNQLVTAANDDDAPALGTNVSIYVNGVNETSEFSRSGSGVSGQFVYTSSLSISAQDTVEISTDAVNTAGNQVASSNITVKTTSKTVTPASANSDLKQTSAYEGEVVAIDFSAKNTPFEIFEGSTFEGSFSSGVNSEVFSWDTEGLGTDNNWVINTTESGDSFGGLEFNLRSLGLTASADSTSVTTNDKITGSLSSNQGGSTVDVALRDSGGSVVASQTVTLDGSGEGTFSFASQSTGNYTVEATDVSTGVTATTKTIQVSSAASTTTSFVSSSGATRGDIGTITVSLTNTKTATIKLGSQSVGYEANITVEDGNGDGQVQLSINTYTMGGNTAADATSAYYVAGDSKDSVVSVDTRFADLTEPIASGSYRTTVRAGDNASLQAQDVSRFSVNKFGGVSSQKIWTAPGSTSASNLLTSVSQDSSIASGDWVVHQINADGVYGVLQNASTQNDTHALLTAVQQGEITVNVKQTQASTRQNRNPKTLDYASALADGTATVVVDAANDTFYVAAPISSLTTQSGGSIEFGNDVYNATVGLNAQATNLTASDSTASAEFSAVKRSTELAKDSYTVEAATNQSITIETTAADGTEFNVLIESQESPGEGYIYPTNPATAADGSATAMVDFSGAAVNSTFEVVLEDTSGNPIDSATGEVVEATQPTTTQPTTTQPTTTAQPTTTQPTTTQPTTTQPTTEQTTEAPQTTAPPETTTPSGESGGGVPGFGMGIALIAIIGAAFLALRQH